MSTAETVVGLGPVGTERNGFVGIEESGFVKTES
jgi:hypothetical protein